MSEPSFIERMRYAALVDEFPRHTHKLREAVAELDACKWRGDSFERVVQTRLRAKRLWHWVSNEPVD